MIDRIKYQDHLKELSNSLDKAEIEKDWDVVGDVRVDMETKIDEIEKEIEEFVKYYQDKE